MRASIGLAGRYGGLRTSLSTEIDIRKGLQYECIGCAACIDACNSVMAKIGAPLGLIRFSTEHAMLNRFSLKQMRQHVLRPRVLIYTGLLLLIVSVSFGSLIMRTPLKLNIIRDRAAMGREVEGGMVENVYLLQIMNTAETSHRYKLAVSGVESIRLTTPDEVVLQGATSRALPVRVRADHGKGKVGSNKIFFELKALDDEGLQVKEKSVFFVPI